MAYYEIYLSNGSTKTLIASSDYNPGVLNPIVEKEVNTSGSLSFTILSSHPQHDEFYYYKSRIDVNVNDQVIFRGRVTSISEDFYKQKSIECEGALGYLNDLVYRFGSEKIYRDVYPDLENLINKSYEKFINVFEGWKRIRLGMYENPGSENICDRSSMIDGRFDINNNFTRDGDNPNFVYISTKMMPIDDSIIYYLSLSSYDDVYNINTYNGDWYLNFYDSNRSHVGGFVKTMEADWDYPDTKKKDYKHAEFGRFKKTDYWDPTNNIQRVSSEPYYFRISLAINRYAYDPTTHKKIPNPSKTASTLKSLFWLQYVNLDVESFTSNDYVETEDTDTVGNYLSSLFIDGRSNFFRTRVYDNKTYLDCLNGQRSVYDDSKPYTYIAPNNHEFEFSVNIMDMTFDDDGIEPYSCIVPVSNGKMYTDTDTGNYKYVENQQAIELFGRIYKTLDVGATSDGGKIAEKTALKRAEKYMKLYDPTLPESITIKALDKGVFFDTEKFQMIDIGDAVHVISEPHGIDKSLICLSLKFDIMNPQNNEYKIGRYIPEGDDYKIKNLTDSFSKSKKK